MLLCISTIDHVTNISCYERLNVLLFLPSEINVHSVERMVEYVGVRGIVCCKNNATPYAPHPTHRNQHLISQKGIYTVALMICKIAEPTTTKRKNASTIGPTLTELSTLEEEETFPRFVTFL